MSTNISCDSFHLLSIKDESNRWLRWPGLFTGSHRADVVGSHELCYFLIFITDVSSKIASISNRSWKETATVGWTWSFSSEFLLGSSPQNLIQILLPLNILMSEEGKSNLFSEGRLCITLQSTLSFQLLGPFLNAACSLSSPIGLLKTLLN